MSLQTTPQDTPPQPAYIFRGHASQIHALHFYKQQTAAGPILTLASGDASGYIILWSLTTKRPLAVWKAHDASILAIHSVTPDKLVTHGRDSNITIWRLASTDLHTLSKTLPNGDTTTTTTDHTTPQIDQTIPSGTVNFCGIALHQPPDSPTITIATPSAQDGFISLLTIPPTTRQLIPSPRDVKVGMVMALQISPPHILAGYESGHVAIWTKDTDTHSWKTVYMRKAHTQPVLSIDAAGRKGVFFSSAADGILARHWIGGEGEVESRQTRHAGQQGLVVRGGDERVFATAGWDGRVRVYATDEGMEELAVLKWHKEGCYAAAFAGVEEGGDGDQVGGRQLTVAQKRVQKAHSTHWLAAGSKDGKISLWDVY